MVWPRWPRWRSSTTPICSPCSKRSAPTSSPPGSAPVADRGHRRCRPCRPIASSRAALRSYVGVEYDNLYETHQLRPHAYGHTWSPGFEIAAGLLHGHAVSIGMGFGAFLSNRAGLLPDDDMHRVLSLLTHLGLSTWHDVLDDHDLVWSAQERMVEKRGGQLLARGTRKAASARSAISTPPTRPELDRALDDYRRLATAGVRGGIGIEPLCSDVGLQDPSVVAADEPALAQAPLAEPGVVIEAEPNAA